MDSPCTKVCVMDAEGRYCLGCARTLNEIAGWGGMGDAERSSVLKELAARRIDGASSTVRPAPEQKTPAP